MKITTAFAVAGFLACAMTTQSSGYDLKLDYTGCYGEHATPSYMGTPYGTVWAGRYNWTVLDAPGTDNPFQVGQNIFTFCVELQNLADPSEFDFAAPEDVPDPGGPPPGPMGESKAKALSSLYAGHFKDAATLGQREAAAFQMCVWEIVYETINYAALGEGEQVTGLGVGGGDFTVGGDANTVALADSWLTNDIFLRSKILDGLLGLTSVTVQDHMYFVPVPAPIALAGVGLAGVVLGRKRLRKLVN